ncbi:MAG: hypothetical protein U9Q89_03825, partial [Thermodesulfobacteriota bacterium]|nr:hypothetical protein [Thermodesulfobacteriota bacterium]
RLNCLPERPKNSSSFIHQFQLFTGGIMKQSKPVIFYLIGPATKVQKFRVQEKDEETEIAIECSVLDICFSFDVGRSMFDVRRSSFNVTSEP